MEGRNVVDGYAAAFLEVARTEGHPDGIGEEVFAIARAVEHSDQLADTLMDPRVPVEKKQAVLTDVLQGRASKVSIALINLLVGTGHTRDFSDVARRTIELAAERERMTVAEVRAPVELDRETVDRLEARLSELTGKRIKAHVVVDPSLIGGLVAKVGDQVFDGSVRTRLQKLREAWR